MKNFKKGFTLIELLVVVAIIAILTSITLGYLSSARKKGNDTAVKSNLSTVRAVSEIFYLNSNSYLPVGGTTFAIATCPSYDPMGANMFSQSKTIADALAEAIKRGNGSSCYNSADVWSVAVGLSLDSSTSWCIDNSGAAKVVSSLPSGAINPITFLCN